jgi:hypothetical protein
MQTSTWGAVRKVPEATFTRARAALSVLSAFVALFLLELVAAPNLFDNLAGVLLVDAVLACGAGPAALLAVERHWTLRVRRAGLRVVGQIVGVERWGFRRNGVMRCRLTLKVDLNAGAPVQRRWHSYRSSPRPRAKATLLTWAVVAVPAGLATAARPGEWAALLLDPANLRRALVEVDDLRADPPLEDGSARPMLG